MKRMRNITTGFCVWVGMSVLGLVVGGIVRGVMQTEDFAVVGVFWAAATAVGMFRFIAFARSDQDLP